MPVKVTYKSKISGSQNFNDIFKDLTAAAENIVSDILDCLQLACLETVKLARSLPQPPATQRGIPHQPNYIDDTTLLRSSIGFVIFDHGKIYASNFEGKGAELSLQVANNAAAPFKNDIVAIVVAGAHYAAAVESKGYDVITGSTKQLIKIFDEKIKIALGK